MSAPSMQEYAHFTRNATPFTCTPHPFTGQLIKYKAYFISTCFFSSGGGGAYGWHLTPNPSSTIPDGQTKEWDEPKTKAPCHPLGHRLNHSKQTSNGTDQREMRPAAP